MLSTKCFAVENSNGRVVRGLLSAMDHDRDAPLVIVPCQYEKVMRENLGVALYLALNGFKVVRYDATGHVGVSDGEHQDFDLHNVYDDFAAVLSHVRSRRAQLRYTRLGVLGVSLSARPLVRYFSQEDVDDVSLLVTLVGVVNVQDTLQRVMKGEDLVGNYRSGREQREHIKVLKYEVRTNFLKQVIARNYDDLATTVQELKRIRTPMTFVIAEQDDWIDPADYSSVLAEGIPALQRVYTIPCSSHELNKNPPAAKTALSNVVASFTQHLKGVEIAADQVVKPVVTDVIEQNKRERTLEMNPEAHVPDGWLQAPGEVVA